MSAASTLLAVTLLFLVCNFGYAFIGSSSPLKTESSSTTSRKVATTAADGNNNDKRVSSRRWNGNYKHASKKLSDVSKTKKLSLDLISNGVCKTLEKKRNETLQHVLTKAIIWSLVMDQYPNIEIEYDIGDPDYLPDVVSVDDESSSATTTSRDQPLFWGESGRMKVHKACDLMRRYPDMDIIHARWSMDIETIAQPLQDYLKEQYELGVDDFSGRKGRFTFCSLPLDVWRFIDEETGEIHVKREDLQWKELEFPK